MRILSLCMQKPGLVDIEKWIVSPLMYATRDVNADIIFCYDIYGVVMTDFKNLLQLEGYYTGEFTNDNLLVAARKPLVLSVDEKYIFIGPNVYWGANLGRDCEIRVYKNRIVAHGQLIPCDMTLPTGIFLSPPVFYSKKFFI